MTLRSNKDQCKVSVFEVKEVFDVRRVFDGG